jgi:GNAT superfamily N-acetyltransferase
MSPPAPEWADKISSFLQRQAPSSFQEKYGITRWKLCENEAGLGVASVMAIDAGNTIVSTCTVTPKRFWRNGVEQPWAEIGDTFTNSDYQRKGMFGALVNASRSRAQSAGFKLVYGLPNNQSLPGYVSKLDFIIKQDLVLNDFYAVISTKAIGLRTRVSRIPLLKKVLCAPTLVVASRQLTKMVLFLMAPKRSQIRIEKQSTFGPEFDCLWQKVRPGLVNAQVRDARYLTWRYGKNPFAFVVFAARRGSELLGYVATLTLHHEGNKALSHTILLDWLYDPASGDGICKALLFAAIDHAFIEGADVISAVACRSSSLPLPFGRAGFFRRPRDTPVIFHNNEAGREVLGDPSPWHFTLSDTDSF